MKNSFHASAKVNGRTKCETDMVNIAGCNVVTSPDRRPETETDGQPDGTEHENNM